jgi:GSCFA family
MDISISPPSVSWLIAAIGNSHIGSLLLADHNGWPGGADVRLSSFRLMQSAYSPHWVGELGSPKLVPQFSEDVRSALANQPPNVVVCFAASNFAFYLGAVNYPHPFDFIVPGCPDLPVIDGATMVPFDGMVQTCRADSGHWGQVIELAKECGGAPVLAISAPPPPADLRPYVPKMADHLRERLTELGLASDAFRLKMWLLQVEVERQIAAEHGAKFLMPPPDAFDGDGFLRQEYCADGLHASAEYGAMLQEQILEVVRTAPSKAVRRPHPYKLLPSHCFWRQSVAEPAPNQVDPVVRPKFTITRADRIATAGSCFAQHIARHLSASGFHYLITEAPHWIMNKCDREEFGYGIFTARYGNIYTSRQLVQLLERAYGLFQPDDDAWQRSDGRIIDPFRPQIQSDGFASMKEFTADRRQHFAAVREAVEALDVFVFTLGLTETWASRSDGAVYPLCPGVVGGEFDPERHGFINLSVDEVVADLGAALDLIREKNANARVILTVSPVPLIATAEDRSVLASTVYSKAVLRVAAEQVSAARDYVAYFPSFEVITGQHARGRYFADDLRSVTAEGVAHVMRLFMRHYADEAVTCPASAQSSEAELEVSAVLQQMKEGAAVMCDEEALTREPVASPQ